MLYFSYPSRLGVLPVTGSVLKKEVLCRRGMPCHGARRQECEGEHTMKEILTGLCGYPAMPREMSAVVQGVVATAKHGGRERQS